MPPLKKKIRLDEGKRPTTNPPTDKPTGWGAVKKYQDESPSNKKFAPRFVIKDGERVIIQFLDSEPFTYMGHSFQYAGNYQTEVCEKEGNKRSCVLCEDRHIKPAGLIGCFRIIDTRGKWDKDSKTFEKTATPEERIWSMSPTVLQQIQEQAEELEKEGEDLTMWMWRVTRTGAKTDTRYNVQILLDEKKQAKKARPISPALVFEEYFSPSPTAFLKKYVGDSPATQEDETYDY